MAGFGKLGRKVVRSGLYKLSGKAVATEDFESNSENIYMLVRAHVKKSGGIAFSDVAKEGLTKEIRLEADQVVLCPDQLVDDVSGFLSSIEDAEALAKEEADAALADVD